MPELRIRPAVPDDIPTILAMVRELAVYENEPVSTVEASEADLMRDCFGERANCEVLIGEVDGAIQGFTLFLHNYSTWLGRAGAQAAGPCRAHRPPAQLQAPRAFRAALESRAQLLREAGLPRARGMAALSPER
jgi:hypothetical protein